MTFTTDCATRTTSGGQVSAMLSRTGGRAMASRGSATSASRGCETVCSGMPLLSLRSPDPTLYLPHFVCCRACYEDVVLAGGLSVYFERAPPQPQSQVWSCDMAVPFIGKGYEARIKLDNSGDWIGFTAEARARMAMQACPGTKATSTWRRPWFMPAAATALEEEEEDIAMCEMYSPRVRKLYVECSEQGGGDPAPLLAFAAHRRAVFGRTVLPIRQMLAQAWLALEQQWSLNAVSSYYNMVGGMQAATMVSPPYGYAQAGLGTFPNHDPHLGAQYGAQAAVAGAAAGSPGNVFIVQQLEQQ
ncbi:hypothetical protein SLS62_010074 [Diatrype stigma]|uniref:Uncharacterized protein n=1 Tax=Diatrype stigma TaxID=117547 RepID=A0AAN9YI23_9PEZI